MSTINYKDYYDLSAYTLSHELSNIIWNIVIKWDYFAKDTIGKQYVKATDSISANIAEGYGRYTKNDKIHFYRYSFGSLKESLSWTQKAFERDLLTQKQFEKISSITDQLPMELNTLIKYTKEKLNF